MSSMLQWVAAPIFVILGIFFGLVVLLFLVGYLMLWRRSPDKKIPETGIELIVGKPGSGKSMYAVYRAALAVISQRRMFYTNLPVKWRVFKAYCRIKTGNPDIARYCQPLTKDHFERAIERFNSYSAFYDLYVQQNTAVDADDVEKAAAERAGRKHARLAVIEKHGEPIYSGPHANDFPKGSIFAIDEVHKWYPAAAAKGDPPELISFLTMHRHGLFWLWFVTQHPKQAAMVIRRNAKHYIECSDVSNQPIWWKIKFPFKLFHYKVWDGDDWSDGEVGAFSKPLKTFAIVPWFTGFVLYRLYTSHTHAGSLRSMLKIMDKTREQIEGNKPEAEKPKKRKIGFPRPRTMILRTLIFLGIVGIGYYIGKRRDQVPPKHEPAKAVAQQGKPYSPMWFDGPGKPTLQGFGDRFVIVDGQKVKLGEIYRGAMLVDIHTAARTTVWKHEKGSDVFTLRYGRNMRVQQPGQKSTAERFHELNQKIRENSPKRTDKPANKPSVPKTEN